MLSYLLYQIVTLENNFVKSINLSIKSHLLQYIPGSKTSKIILTSGHGGLREPESIPFRLAGCRGVIGDEGVSREGCVYKVIGNYYCSSIIL